MKRAVVVVVVLCAVAAAFAVRWMPRPQRASGAGTLPHSSSDEPPRLWDAPPFEFASQSGRALRHDELLGQVWIADFIFTQCTSICPTMTAKMVLLQRSLSAPQLRFVSFSVDPEHDTPEVLATYASAWSPGETRWWLLATDAENLLRVAKGFGVTVQKTDDADDPILHSNRFFLVDPRGLIRGAYLSDDEEALERLVGDANTLLAREFAAQASERPELAGAELFGAMGCAGCHSNPRLGPPLPGIWERASKLADGGEVRVDAQYLRQSIVDPLARIVDGYRGTMPSYAGVLSDAQIERVLEHLRELRRTDGPDQAPRLTRDPVCAMEVTVFADSPSMEYGGQRYWFCCEHCRERFAEAPSAFVDAKQ